LRKIEVTLKPYFHGINKMPIVLYPARLNEGGGIEETLKRNKNEKIG
jgi:hypothetical protein